MGDLPPGPAASPGLIVVIIHLQVQVPRPETANLPPMEPLTAALAALLVAAVAAEDLPEPVPSAGR